MTDLSSLPPPAPTAPSAPSGRAEWRGALLFSVAVLAAFALVGLAAGWLWHELWQPSEGVVVRQQWYADGAGLRQDFSGTGLYVLVAAGAGLALGVACALLGSTRPVLTLVLCVAGSVLAAWLMLTLGERLGPPDPQELAKDAEDGTRLPSALRVSGLPPLLAFSLGSLAALAAVFTLFPSKGPEARSGGEPPG